MKNTLLLLLLPLLFQISVYGQNDRVTASGKTAKFGSGSMAMVKTRTKPKDKKMGLSGPRRPDNIENEDVGAAFNTLEEGNYDDAIEQLDDYSDSDPDAAFGLGFAYYLDGQTDRAIEAFQQMAELDPENTDALYYLGLIYAEEGDYEKAEEKLLDLLTINPMDETAWYELGFLYLDAGYYEDAYECFDTVLLINPEDPDAPYEMARLHAISGNTEEALSALELAFANGFYDAEFVRMDPDLEEVRNTEAYEELMATYFPE